MRRKSLLAAVSVLASFVAVSAPASAEDPPGVARPYWFRFVEEYRFRQAGGSDTAGLHGESEDDHDLRLAGEG
ncbi:MAG: hypothetical protein FJ098_16655, partial [Deltaproteobacteria bacterium]|nr:hypothetical protein [Deltaproteobacteria bacterium]